MPKLMGGLWLVSLYSQQFPKILKNYFTSQKKLKKFSKFTPVHCN